MTVSIENNSNMSLYKYDSDRFLKLSGDNVSKAVYVNYYLNVFESMEVYVASDYTVAIPNQLLDGDYSGEVPFTVNSDDAVLYEGQITILDKAKPEDYELKATELKNDYNFEITSTPTVNPSYDAMLFSEENITELDLGDWSFPTELTTLRNMLNGYSNLTKVSFGEMDTSKVTTVSRMFSGCSSLTDIDLSSFNTSSLEIADYMFQGCTALKSLNLNGWNFSNVVSQNNIFVDCTALETLSLNGVTFTNTDFTTESQNDSGETVTITTSTSILSDAIENCTALKELNLSGATFNGTSFPKFTYTVDSKVYASLEKIDFSNMSAPNVTSIMNLFGHCYNVVSIDISNFSIPSGIKANWLFMYDKKLTSINFKGFDTSRVTTMTQWFFGCSSIETLDLSTFDTSNCKDFSWFCTGCSSLKNITLSNNWASNTLSCSTGEYDPLDFSDSPLTHDSCLDIFNKLATRTDTSYEHRVYISPTTYSYMSSSEFKIAIDKGWSIYYKTDSGSMLKGTYQQITI